MIYVFAKDGNTKAILELTDSIGEEMEKDSRMVYCDNPVSYTHLDVYKRQVVPFGTTIVNVSLALLTSPAELVKVFRTA